MEEQDVPIIKTEVIEIVKEHIVNIPDGFKNSWFAFLSLHPQIHVNSMDFVEYEKWVLKNREEYERLMNEFDIKIPNINPYQDLLKKEVLTNEEVFQEMPFLNKSKQWFWQNKQFCLEVGLGIASLGAGYLAIGAFLLWKSLN